MGLGVLWVNAITWSLRELVTRATKEEGELIPALHPHRLHLNLALAAHWCDLCHQQVTGTIHMLLLCYSIVLIVLLARWQSISL